MDFFKDICRSDLFLILSEIFQVKTIKLKKNYFRNCNKNKN